MTDAAKLEQKFWKELRSDTNVFLGCDGAPPRPMAAIIDGDKEEGPLWFFTSTDTDLGRVLSTARKPGIMTFVNKGYDLWASASGTLSIDTDPAKIDKLWSPAVAAWFDGGKDDPKLRLVRFDVREAELWEDASTLAAGIKSLLGGSAEGHAEDHKAHVRLDD